MEYITLYIISALTFLILDSFWLGAVAPKFYKKYIGHVMAKKANFTAAGIFYAIFIAGLVFFVLQPAVQEELWTTALTHGALFGLVTYATYDLTSQAVIKDWPWLVTIVDLLWGTFITMIVSVVSFYIYSVMFI